ncbi:MAG: c-type cytochrome [Caulobacteraceae bacterium]
MKTLLLAGLAAGALIALGSSALATDAAHGQQLFRAQCGVCHQAGEGDGDGGAGPALRGVVGRKVGGDTNFGYSQALSDSKESWTEDNLGVFLADPNKAKPGTSMPISVKNDADRADLIAYLASLKAQ